MPITRINEQDAVLVALGSHLFLRHIYFCGYHDQHLHTRTQAARHSSDAAAVTLHRDGHLCVVCRQIEEDPHEVMKERKAQAASKWTPSIACLLTRVRMGDESEEGRRGGGWKGSPCDLLSLLVAC